MSEPALRIAGLTRIYVTGGKRLPVLTGIDLSVSAGEIVGLVGPSGSGKSSLLHAAGLLEHPTAGSIVIDGRACGALCGFIYQFHHLLPELSAIENVALPAMIAGHSGREARVRAERLLNQLGLAKRLRHQPAQLSGGEQQRVAVGRALVNAPRLLLADEPTGNLDPATSEAVFQAIQHLVQSTGVGALIATHNLEMTRHMDRVLALKDGRVVQVG
jgi:lipoprotein-releasing system ATP-binding protein